MRGLSDSNGSLTDSFAYDAYGNLIERTGSTPTNYLFAGEQFDHDLNLYYNRARYLDVNRGRFWSQDSFEGYNGEPLSLHKYLYANGNPVNRIDPSGNLTTVELLGGIAIIGAVLAAIAVGYKFYKGEYSLGKIPNNTNPLDISIHNLPYPFEKGPNGEFDKLHLIIDESVRFVNNELKKKGGECGQLFDTAKNTVGTVDFFYADGLIVPALGDDTPAQTLRTFGGFEFFGAIPGADTGYGQVAINPSLKASITHGDIIHELMHVTRVTGLGPDTVDGVIFKGRQFKPSRAFSKYIDNVCGFSETQ